MVLNIFLFFLLQIVFTLGIILLFGWLIAFCNRKFYANFGRYGLAVCYITGFIGTPIHELSHALFCLIFGHKITKIKLFQINSEDGTLGYVCHTYNKRNIYHRIGNFFIGVAPILIISALLYLLAWLLIPSFIQEIGTATQSMKVTDAAGMLSYIWDVMVSFFSAASSWRWWVFVLIGMFLALHMSLSDADIKGAVGGVVFVIALFLIADIIIGLISADALRTFTLGVIAVGSGLLCFLLLALLISLVAVIISYLVRIKFRRRL